MQTETLVEAYKTIDEIAGWFQSFYNDVMVTTPEYAESCGDLNALTYLLSEAQRHREQARSHLYDHFSDNHTPEAAAQYLEEPEPARLHVGASWSRIQYPNLAIIAARVLLPLAHLEPRINPEGTYILANNWQDIAAPADDHAIVCAMIDALNAVAAQLPARPTSISASMHIGEDIYLLHHNGPPRQP